VVNCVFLPGENGERFGKNINGRDGAFPGKPMSLWHHHAHAKEPERLEVHATNSIRWMTGDKRGIKSSPVLAG